MTGPSTNEIPQPAEQSGLTDIIFFEDGSALSDAAVETLLHEMGASWRQGGSPRVEEFLERHPRLGDSSDAVLRLICEEICLREETGAEINPEDYLKRFPRWRSEVQALLDCRRVMGSEVNAADVEQVPALSDFHLLAELGAGAQGQVYLATQPALADRPVVLKITRCHGEEHRSLARLQHTHIVPLYWAQDAPELDQRILCMPYFGNVTLGELFKELKDKPPALRTGKDIFDVLEKGRAGAAVALPATGPARQYLARAGYVEAVVWMGACLADALHYAHERHLLHLDVKPTNVLLAADGQPMLLDFHLARAAIGRDSAPPRGMGGTPYFMSPEQQLAMEAVCSGRKVTLEVDCRSDVYSLGLVLYQALSGQVPMQVPPPRLEQCNPQVSVGLADVIQQCLARDPGDRYDDAASLATDLRRHLGNLPLKGVPNRSWPERWRKWRKRKPHALAISILFSALLALVLSVGWRSLNYSQERLETAKEALGLAKAQIVKKEYQQALESLEYGRGIAASTPGGATLEQRFEQLLRVAQHGLASQTLHSLVNQLRFLPVADEFSASTLRQLEKQCRILWEKRDLLLHDPDGDGKPLPVRKQLRIDLLDLALIWTNVRVRLASPAEDRNERRAALRVLDEAERLFGNSPVLLYERLRHYERLGLIDEFEQTRKSLADLRPRTAWEYYALGLSNLQAGQYRDALRDLDAALLTNPGEIWPNFYQGVCAYKLGHYEDAVAAFRVCLSLSAEMSAKTGEPAGRCYNNRALAEVALGNDDRALSDYTQALARDPELGVAALNRGILHYRHKRYSQARDDLSLALEKGCDPLAGNYNLALVYLALHDPPAALVRVRRALEVNPRHRESLELLSRLQPKKR